jgi:DNA polymerase elongation subunit (family B)
LDDSQKIRFLLTDINYVISKDGTPIFKLYGKNTRGSILVQVDDFRPYFYVKRDQELKHYRQSSIINNWFMGSEELTLREFFWGGHPIKVTRVYGKNPLHLAEIRKSLEQLHLKTYETDIGFIDRFLIDNNIRCLNVLEVTTSQVKYTDDEQLIATASYKDILPVSEEEIPESSLFYDLLIMAVKIKVSREKETLKDIIDGKNLRIITITAYWGRESVNEAHHKQFVLHANSDEDEKQLIKDFIRLLDDIRPDILCTYHGDRFDLPILLYRMKELRIPNTSLSLYNDEKSYYTSDLKSHRIHGRIPIDLSNFDWEIKIYPPSGKKDLIHIGQHLFPERTSFKIKDSAYSTWKSALYENNQTSLKKLQDKCFAECKLIYDLYYLFGSHAHISMIKVTGYPIYKQKRSTARLHGEYEIYRYMKELGVLIPPMPSAEREQTNLTERKERAHEGGTVLTPKGKLHIGVVIADFFSMYPSVMAAHNIGPDARRSFVKGNEVDDVTKHYCSDRPSAISLMEEKILNKRLILKEKIKELEFDLGNTNEPALIEELTRQVKLIKRKIVAMKGVAAFIYGAFGYYRSRFYSQELASAVTESARKHLLSIDTILKELSDEFPPCEVIYGDTDSVFIKLLDGQLVAEIYNETDPEMKQILLDELFVIINKVIDKLNATFPHPLKLEIRDISYKLIFKPEVKKGYAYQSLLSDNLVVKGFEAIRSDRSPLTKKVQVKVLEMLLQEPEENPNLLSFYHQEVQENFERKEFQKAEQFLFEYGKEVMQMPFEQLLPKVITYLPIKKHPNKYKSITPGIGAFVDYLTREGLDENEQYFRYEKFPFVIGKDGPKQIFKRALHPKYVTKIDREHYITRMLSGTTKFGLNVTPAMIIAAAKNRSILEFIKPQLDIVTIQSELGSIPTVLTTEENLPQGSDRVILENGQTLLSSFFDELGE